MLDIRLDNHSSTPIYSQIAEQLRRLIATGQLAPDDRLPSIRSLSKAMKINPNTIYRAYAELEQEGSVVSRRGGGTTVAGRDNMPDFQAARRKRLLEDVHEDIIKNLSQGFSPEELEAAFYLSLERWREERKTQAAGTVAAPARKESNLIRIVGSHDLALNVLLDLLRQRTEGLKTEVTHAGSLGGLIALQEERADMAGIHLLDEETGEYNYPFVKRILPGREMAVVNLSFRVQGLMFTAGNPRGIKGLADLRRTGIVFVNRQKGAGTRVLLDLQLKKLGISPASIKGYEVELDTHLAVASHISGGKADAGLGIEAAARSYNLGFLPLFRERYDLVIPISSYKSRRLAPMLEIIPSDEFKKIVEDIGGYDTSQTGTTTFIK